jgi:modification methylase
MEVNKIYNEDCLTTMARIKDNSVDLVITSPPYNKAGYEGFIRKRHRADSWSNGRNIEYDGIAENDFMIEADYQEQQIKVLNELHRILKPNGSVFYNHKVRVAQHKASHPIEWILKSNFTFRQQLIWNRKNSPVVAPIRYLPNTELIFWLTKTPCQPNFERVKEPLFVGEVWEFSAKPNKLHPAPFPEELPTNIMMCIKDKENIVVYDPYIGTGTTCKVAKQFGFNYIGSEINKGYFELAEKQINGTLF